MPVVLPNDARKRIQAMSLIMKGKGVVFSVDGQRHTLTPESDKTQKVSAFEIVDLDAAEQESKKNTASR